ALAIRQFVNSSHCFSKCKPDDASKSMQMAIQLAQNEGRFVQAGKLLQELGKTLEEGGHVDMAVDKYNEAIEVLQDEEKTTTDVRNLRLQICEILTGQGKYTEPSQLYEAVGIECTKTPLLRFHAREYLLRAVLCMLA
ncbi:NSF attachment protein, partial [Kipferlia bialata]